MLVILWAEITSEWSACALSHISFSFVCLMHVHTHPHTHTNDLTWCCSRSVTSMAYSWVGWLLHTLPWLSTSPRRTSKQNRMVSTAQRIWREGKGEGEGGGRGAGGEEREGGRGRRGESMEEEGGCTYIATKVKHISSINHITTCSHAMQCH